MVTIRQLLTQLGKLECRSKAGDEFQVVEQFIPEGEFNGECHFALLRNGIPVVHWPRKLSFAEWQQRYLPTRNEV